VFYLDNPLKLSGVISGPGSIRTGTGSNATLFLTNNNTYTGFTNLQDGSLSIASIGNGGVSRNIGSASNAATNLVFSNGTLRYTGVGESTDRLFTIGSASSSYLATGTPAVDLNATVTGTIDSSGSGPLVFSNTGSLIVGNALNNVLQLTGSNTGNNTLAAVIADSTDNSSVVLANCTTTSTTNGSPNRQVIVTNTTGILVGDAVSGTGIPANAIVTAVLGPTRVAILGGATLTQNANATLTFTNPNIALNKTRLLKSGNGTWVLAGTASHTGGTSVNAGTLLITGNHSAATGALTVASGATLGGTGRIGGNVTVMAGGHLAPGTSAGVLSLDGGLDLSGASVGGSSLHYELDAPGGISDRIDVGGELNIGNGILGFTDFTFTNLGGVQPGNYTLMTSAALVGGNRLDGTDLTGPVGGYDGTLEISGSNLVLTVTDRTPSFASWAAAAGLTGEPGRENGFDDDPEADGLPNGIEWVLGGDPLARDSASIAPFFDEHDVLNFAFTFPRTDESESGTTVFVEYSATLSAGGWTQVPIGASDSSAPNSVTVKVTENAGAPDTIKVILPKSLALNGRLFARLKVSVPPAP